MYEIKKIATVDGVDIIESRSLRISIEDAKNILNIIKSIDFYEKTLCTYGHDLTIHTGLVFMISRLLIKIRQAETGPVDVILDFDTACDIKDYIYKYLAEYNGKENKEEDDTTVLGDFADSWNRFNKALHYISNH